MMENYQEKYKKELYQQEINSNIHTLKGFFWIFVTILLLWLLTLVRIFIVDARIFTMAAGKPKILSGQRFPQTAQPSADYPWGGD